MPFDARDFTMIGTGGTGAPRIFSYQSSADAIATCVASGYFNTYASQIRTGDIILIGATDEMRWCRLINTANVITVGVDLNFA